MPTTAISISMSGVDQVTAALFLSEYLKELGCPHAFIGGFAWMLLGSTRPTQIKPNVLIEAKDLLEIRDKLSERNKQFATAGIHQLFFVKELIGDLRDDDLVIASKDNVLIETLMAGNLGLPNVVEPVLQVAHSSGKVIPILHPSILILTKLNRWSNSVQSESTRPKTLRKIRSDEYDIEFILIWLADHNTIIAPDRYQGQSKEKLLSHVRVYKNKFIDNVALMEALESVLDPEDWKSLAVYKAGASHVQTPEMSVEAQAADSVDLVTVL